MDQPNLLIICIAAYVAVFLLLAFLATTMRVLMAVFPKKMEGIDPAIVVALTAAATYAFPGTKVTKVEETR
ncbi:MAG: hypothetical protein ACQET1_06990 [Gemmatimonadota bacterium]